MAFTLLFDLDDTLLLTNLTEFVQAYIRALAKHMASYDLPASFAGILMNSTRKMLENENPAVTLADVFNNDFFPALQAVLPLAMQAADKKATSYADHPVRTAIDRFYQEVFPSLKDVTRPTPGALDLIQEARGRNYRIAIATNPLFPKIATHQRLAWAGLPQDSHPFELVSTYEDFHFTKPKPAYYAEVLAQMGWQDGPVIMVGNELRDDMEGAMRLGLCTYWAKPDGKSLTREEMTDPCMAPAGSGDLSELLNWIDRQSTETLTPQFLKTNESILAVLRSTPAALATLTKRLQDNGAWQRQPQLGSWSPGEICCHLRDIEEEIYLPRLSITLKEVNPLLEDFHGAAWANERGYHRQDGAAALRGFVQARLETLALLGEIGEADWTRTALHPRHGQVTFFSLAQKIALHDQDHIRQLKAALLEAY